MRANAALFMVLLGVSIVLMARGRSAAAVVLAALAAVPPLLDIIDWVLGRDIGLDLFLFRDQQARLDAGMVEPGRLSPGATVVLLCLSVAVILLRRLPRRRTRWPRRWRLGSVRAHRGCRTAPAPSPGRGRPGVALHGAAARPRRQPSACSR